MHRLFLLRHAKTETFSPSGIDRDRRLEGRGHTDAETMGAWLHDHLNRPAQVLVSTAVRTQQTWNIIIKELGDADISKTDADAIYSADTPELIDIIRGASGGPDTLLLIGHNPGLHELALALLRGRPEPSSLLDNLPTSGVVVIDLPINDWSEISFRNGELVHFVTPRILRDSSFT